MSAIPQSNPQADRPAQQALDLWREAFLPAAPNAGDDHRISAVSARLVP